MAITLFEIWVLDSETTSYYCILNSETTFYLVVPYILFWRNLGITRLGKFGWLPAVNKFGKTGESRRSRPCGLYWIPKFELDGNIILKFIWLFKFTTSTGCLRLAPSSNVQDSIIGIAVVSIP